MAVQIAGGLIPPLRRVIARFLALFGSIKDVLLGAFWAIFFLIFERSAEPPWALVLKCSSNISMFSSWHRQNKKVIRDLYLAGYCVLHWKMEKLRSHP